MMQETSSKTRASLFASLSLAFAGLGDAFLYPFLPVNHDAAEVPVGWIGILLSINRFVRIVSNTWMVHLLASYGLRVLTISAVVLAILSTAGYAFASGLYLWLLLRVLWGLAFSALRITTIAYSLQQSRHGFALGLTRGIQETGPMLALFLAPVLLHWLPVTGIFLALGVLTLPALYFAWNLPTGDDKTSPVLSFRAFQPPSMVSIVTFISAFLVEGVIVVVLGFLLLRYSTNNTLITATSAAALYLGYRRICLVLFAPAGGWLADRIGTVRIFNFSLGLVIMGLALVAYGLIEAGAIITFTFYSINAAITPGYVSMQPDHPLMSIATNATWRDMGAAMGTLAGGFLLSSAYLINVFILIIFALAVLFAWHCGTAQRVLKFLYLWR